MQVWNFYDRLQCTWQLTKPAHTADVLPPLPPTEQQLTQSTVFPALHDWPLMYQDNKFHRPTQCDILLIQLQLTTVNGSISWLWQHVDGRHKCSKFRRHTLLMCKAFFAAVLIFSSNGIDYQGNSWLQIFRPAHKLTHRFRGKKPPKIFQLVHGNIRYISNSH